MDSKELKELIKERENRAEEDEQRRLIHGDAIASGVGYLVGMALILLEFLAKKQFDYGLCGVLFTYSAVGNFSEGSKTGKLWKYVIGAFCSLVAFVMIFMFLGTVVFG